MMILQQEVVFDNGDSPEHTLVFVGCENRPGLLSDITSALKQMDIRSAPPLGWSRTALPRAALHLPPLSRPLRGDCPHTTAYPPTGRSHKPSSLHMYCSSRQSFGVRGTCYCGGVDAALRRHAFAAPGVARSVKDAQIKTSGDKVMDVFTVARKEGGQLPETSWPDVRAALTSVVGSDPTASDDEIYFQV
jgi:hypothetical protein